MPVPRTSGRPGSGGRAVELDAGDMPGEGNLWERAGRVEFGVGIEYCFRRIHR